MCKSMIAQTHLIDRECVRVGLHQRGPSLALFTESAY
jgi:hypothetical protein